MINESLDKYLKLLLDLSNIKFNDIPSLIKTIEKIISKIKINIYILKQNNELNLVNKYTCDNQFCYSISEDNLSCLLQQVEITEHHKIRNEYFEFIDPLNFSSMKNIIFYPLRYNSETYGFIFVYNIDNADKYKIQIDILLNLININLNNSKILKIQNIDYVIYYRELLNALKLKQFKFLYQPKFSLKDGKISGAELLIRWHKDDIIIPPDNFIEKLERYNLIHIIDYYVMEQLLKKLKCLTKKNIVIPISMNLSKSTLMRNDFIKNIDLLLEKYDVDTKYIEFEITEREYVDYSLTEINEIISKVRLRGIKVSLDDFGSGNANLAFTLNMNIDTVKIDKSITEKMGKNKNIDILSEFILELFNHNNIDIIAEGIETKEQLNLLIETGYKFGQGYYLSRPINYEQLEKKYLNNNTKE